MPTVVIPYIFQNYHPGQAPRPILADQLNANFAAFQDGFGLVTVVNQAISYAVQESDSGAIFTNSGASTAIVFVLPEAAAGLNYTFIVATAQTVTVSATSDATISLGETTSASGGTAVSATPYTIIRLVAISDTTWVALAATGTWDVT